MKKIVAASLVFGWLAAAAAAPAWARDQKVTFSLNAGVQTNIFLNTSRAGLAGYHRAFDQALFTLDARVGLLVGRSFQISPEVMVVMRYLRAFGSDGLGTMLYPGVLLNYRTRNFFAGIGAVLPWAFVGGASDTGNPAPKINVGYTFSNGIQVTAYYLTWTESGLRLFDIGFAGVTIGYRF